MGRRLPLGGAWRVLWGPAYQPSASPGPVRVVFGTEQARERGFLVPDDEGVCGEQEQASIARQSDRAIEKRGPTEGQDSPEVHGIAYVPVGTANHQAAGWIEGGRRSVPDHDKRQDAPQRDRRTCGSHEEAGVLQRAKMRRLNDAGPFENPAGQEHQEHTDKECRVGSGTGQNERGDLRELLLVPLNYRA